MNDTDIPAATDTRVPPQFLRKLHTLLRILCGAVRTFRPTWEEWQVAVDLHPVAGLEPVTAVESVP